MECEWPHSCPQTTPFADGFINNTKVEIHERLKWASLKFKSDGFKKVTEKETKGTDLDDIISKDTLAKIFIPKTEKLDILIPTYPEDLNKHSTQRGDIGVLKDAQTE